MQGHHHPEGVDELFFVSKFTQENWSSIESTPFGSGDMEVDASLTSDPRVFGAKIWTVTNTELCNLQQQLQQSRHDNSVSRQQQRHTMPDLERKAVLQQQAVADRKRREAMTDLERKAVLQQKTVAERKVNFT